MGNTYIFDDSHDYTGAVATFTDTHGTSRITNISVPFSPIQDLHGYSSPWPAGGGKNLYGGENISAPSTSNTTFEFPSALPSASYVLSFELSNVQKQVTGVTSVVRVYYSDNTDYYFDTSEINRVSDNQTMQNGTYPLSGRYYLKVANKGITKITWLWRTNAYLTLTSGSISKIMLEAGTTPTDFAPYSNICPISGRTGVDVYDDPKYGGTIEWNQLMRANASGGTSGVSAMFNITTGELTLDGTASAVAWVRFLTESVTDHVYYVNDGGLKSSYPEAFIYNDSGGVIASTGTTIGKATSNKAFYIRSNSGVTFSNYTCKPIIIDLTQMFGSTIADFIYALETANAGAGVAWFRNLFPKDYYPYNAGEQTCVSAVNGDPYWKKTVDWTSQAGTVYGGTLDVVTGVLTVDRAMVDLGTLTWDYITNDGTPYYFRATADGKAAGSFNVISNIFKTSSAAGTGNLPDCGIVGSASSSYVYVRWDAYTDATAFKTAVTGETLVYTLATPLTYQLTAQEVSVIKNSLNNVWASTGSSITVTVNDIAYGFQGWLVKVGSSLTLVPTEMIEAESYKVTPDQRMEESAERDTTGYLWRDTVRNTPPKIEFNTPPVNNTQVAALNAIFQSAFTVKSQRKLQVAFFDPEEDCYKIWDCYMPDVEYPMHLIDPDAKTILYDSIRYAFIGY